MREGDEGEHNVLFSVNHFFVVSVKEGLVLFNVIKTYPGVFQALSVDAVVFVFIGLADITVSLVVFLELGAHLEGEGWVKASMAEPSILRGPMPFLHVHLGPLGAMGRVVPVMSHV